MAKVASRKSSGRHAAKSATSGNAERAHASKQVRIAARSVIVQYRKALKDLEKH